MPEPALVAALAEALAAHPVEPRKMFGGTCFMLNENLLIGTHKQGLIVRVGPEATDRALELGGEVMVMGGRPMAGWVLVDHVESLGPWIEMALAFNRTLPRAAARSRRKKG